MLVSILKSDKINLRHTEDDADKNNALLLCAPIKGRIIELQEAGDTLFCEGKFGKGAAIIPETNLVVAPTDGVVESISKKLNAITIKGKNGAEVFIHIGVDTGEMEGKVFETFVNVGDSVRCGEPLIEFDTNAIKISGYDLTVFMTVINSEDYALVEAVLENAAEQKPFIKITKTES